MYKTLIATLLSVYVLADGEEVTGTDVIVPDGEVENVAEGDAGLEVEDEEESNFFDDVFGSMSKDSVEAACLIYDDLTTWDLRPMSFREIEDGETNPGEYFFYENDETSTGLGFNPCAYINWDLVSRPEAIEQIEYDTFAYWVEDNSSSEVIA